MLVGVFGVNFDQAANEELLLFGSASFPVVWLVYSNDESNLTSPLFVLGLFLTPRYKMDKILDVRQIGHVPCFAYRESTIGVFSSLMERYSASIFYCDDNDSGFLVIGVAAGGRGCLRIGAIFLDADVCDIGFMHWDTLA